jgi:ariadne-1
MDASYDEIEYGDEIYCYEEDISTTSNNLGRQSSYAIVKSDDLEKTRDTIIRECMDFTCLNKDDSIIVLTNYQWNIERIRDQWFDDVEMNRKKCGLDLLSSVEAELKKKKILPNNKECLVCYEPKDNTFDSLSCLHFFCGECWKQYLEAKLEDILTCITSTCPLVGCNIVVPETKIRKYLSKEKLIEYQKVIFKNFTDYNVDMKWCPTPDCGICIRSVSHFGKEITCECKYVFCFKCGKEGHRPLQCEIVQAWNIKNNSESENVKWLQANTKQCPGCHKFIEKNQGCNHMTCRKEAGGCGFEFCWICMGEWKPHGGSYYQCNKFDSEKLKSSQNNQKQIKFQLEKYIWHFDRYMNHEKAMKLSEKLRKTVQDEMKTFNKDKNLPYDELRFMEDAIETIIKTRRTLKNTYVFGYYMKEGVKERQLFEHNQFLLEKDADRLHEMMENETKRKLLEISTYEQFMKEWNNFKANVTNLSTVSIKYQENLLSEIENKMMDLVDYKAAKI